jgi:head-tail adaptor
MATPRGRRDHLVTFEGPGVPVPDGDGGFTVGYTPLVPASAFAAIEAPAIRDLERESASTVIATQAYIMTFDPHPQVTTETRVSWLDRRGRTHTANVTGVRDPDVRPGEMQIICVEDLGA